MSAQVKLNTTFIAILVLIGLCGNLVAYAAETTQNQNKTALYELVVNKKGTVEAQGLESLGTQTVLTPAVANQEKENTVKALLQQKQQDEKKLQNADVDPTEPKNLLLIEYE